MDYQPPELNDALAEVTVSFPTEEAKPVYSVEGKIKLLYQAVRFLLNLRVDEGNRLKELDEAFKE